MNIQRFQYQIGGPTGHRPVRLAKEFCAVYAALFLIMVPAQGLAFDFTKALRDATESVQKQINKRTQKKIDQGEKKVEETIDHTLEQKPHSPSQRSAPAQQGASGQSSAGQGTSTVAVGGSLQGKVHEQLVGPDGNNNRLVKGVFFSPDGGHIAIAMVKGSRQVMVVDGVEGPVFDELFIQHGATFDPTGQHCAYVGRRGAEIIGVVDGREIGRIAPSESSLVLMLKGGGPLKFFHFNGDGTRLAYLFFAANGNQPGGGYYAGATQPQWAPVHMIVDGKRSPGYAAIDMTQISFAGKRLAYAAQTSDKKWHMVIDGKIGPAYEGVRALQWSGDGVHYGFIAKRDWQYEVVVIDGKEGKNYPDNASGMGIDALSVTVHGHVAYRAQGISGSHGMSSGNVLVLDQKEITQEAINFSFAHTALLSQPSLGQGMLNSWWFALSPDGRRVAYVKKTSGGEAAVIGGKSGFSYDKIFDLQFSPDSKRVAYIGQKGLFNFVVVDGDESSRYQRGDGVKNFRFSSDGSHYAFEAARPGEMNYAIAVDGAAGPDLTKQKMTLLAGSLIFSANGVHYAYAANQIYPGHNPKWALIVDGKLTVKSGRIERFQKRDVSGVDTSFPVLAISPDGSRLAYALIPLDERSGRQHLMVGTQAYPLFSSYSFPTFSPNGRHFAVVAWSTQVKKEVILVDGKKGPAYDRIAQPYEHLPAMAGEATYRMQRANAAAFRFLDDQTLQFLAVRNGSMYRVRINVGG